MRNIFYIIKLISPYGEYLLGKVIKQGVSYNFIQKYFHVTQINFRTN